MPEVATKLNSQLTNKLTYGDVRWRHPEMCYPLGDSHSFRVFEVENIL